MTTASRGAAMPPCLSTPRLDLRPAAAGDVDVLWTLWRDPNVRRYLFDDIPVTRERAAGVVGEALSLGAAGLGLWMIAPRNGATVARDAAPAMRDAACIGCVGLMRVTTSAAYDPRLSGAVEPVVALVPAFWHRGYAREAVRAVIAYAFTNLRLPAMVAVTDTPNEASHRMLVALGFEATGECDGPRYRMRSYALTPERFAAIDATPAAESRA